MGLCQTNCECRECPNVELSNMNRQHNRPRTGGKQTGWNRVGATGALLLVFGALVIWHAARGPDFLAAAYFNDDSFYYLQSAHNLAHRGFLTFDGVNPTNGVHFLWTLVLALWARLFPAKDAFVVAVFLLSATLVGAGAWLLGRLTAQGLRAPTWGHAQPAPDWLPHAGATLTTGLILLLALARLPYLLAGMEASLLLPLFALLLENVRRLYSAIETGSHAVQPKLLWRYAGLFVLVVWTRLDYALPLAVLTLCLILFAAWGKGNLRSLLAAHWRTLAGALGLLALAVIVQLGINYVWNATLIPISGTIKTAGTRPLLPHLQMTAYVLAPVPARLPFHWPLRYGGAALLLAQTLVASWQIARTAHTGAASSPAPAHTFLIAALGGSTLAYALLAGQAMHEYFRWYLVISYTFWALVMPLWMADGLRLWANRLPRALQPGPRVPAWLGLGCATLAVLFALAIPLGTFYPARIAAARAISRTLPPACTLAAWNAGALGYFTQQSLVNLDGLVNSKAYRDEYLYRPARLPEYLQQQGIDFVVDYRFYWGTPQIEAYPVIQEYDLGRSGMLQVRRTPYADCTN